MAKNSLNKTARIVWAIARKDIVDAIRNKTILTTIGSVLFVVLMYRFLPGLDDQDLPVRVMLYDGGDSALTMELEESPNVLLSRYDSREQMKDALVQGDRLSLGLVLPPDLEPDAARDAPLELQGYIAYWIGEREARRLVDLVEQEVAYVADRPVRIAIDEGQVYPGDPGQAGSGFLVSVAIVVVLVMMGALVVTHLLLDEKQAKTMDVLLISPASPVQLLLGKALVGLVYVFVGAGVVLALNAAYIVRWEVAVLGTLWGALFTVNLGILLGVLFESQQQLIMWGFVLMGTLMLPLFLVVGGDALPGGVAVAFRYLPTTATAWIIRASFAPIVPVGRMLVRLGVVGASTAIVFALAAWRVARLER